MRACRSVLGRVGRPVPLVALALGALAAGCSDAAVPFGGSDDGRAPATSSTRIPLALPCAATAAEDPWAPVVAPDRALVEGLTEVDGRLFAATATALARRDVDGWHLVRAFPYASWAHDLTHRGSSIVLATDEGLLEGSDLGVAWAELGGLGRTDAAAAAGTALLSVALDPAAGYQLFRFDDAAGAWDVAITPLVPWLWNDLATDGERFIASGEGAGVLVSDDGVAWSAVGALDTWGYQAVARRADALAAAHGPALHLSSDGGATWALAADPLVGPVRGVGLFDEVVAVAGPQGVALSIDGGSTWQTTSIDARAISATTEALFVAGDGLWRVDAAGLESIEGPAISASMATFAIEPKAGEPPDAGERLITSTDTRERASFLSQDGGATWKRLALPFDGALTGIADAGDAHLGLVHRALPYASPQFGDGELVRSKNGGRGWAPLARPAGLITATLVQIAAHGGSVFLTTAASAASLGGGGGSPGVFRSDDAGATWQAASEGLPVVGYDDAGPTFATPRALVSIEGPAGSALLAPMDDGTLQRRDAERWSAVALPSAVAVDHVVALAGAAVVVGHDDHGAVLLESTDAGATFAPVESEGLPASALAGAVGRGAFLAVLTTEGEVLVSHDGGRRFRAAATGTPARRLDLVRGRVFAATLAEGALARTVGCGG